MDSYNQEPKQDLTVAEEIFFNALSINDSVEREAYLSSVCRNDRVLCENVGRLMMDHGKAEKLFSNDIILEISAEDLIDILYDLAEGTKSV